jgi:glycosyltransferase involved in cell wall biosynthesis
MPHLRVALVSDWFLPRLGGIEIHLRDLANHLARAGHQVEVVTPLPGPTQVDNVHVRRVRTTLCPKLKVLCGPFGFARLARTL